MKTGKLGSLLPTQSLVLCGLCAAGLLVFVLFLILPAQRLSAELDRDIEGLKSRIEEQKLLLPVFKSLFEKSKAPAAPGLPLGPRTKLGKSEIAGVPRRLQELAAAHRLDAREVVPEVNTLTDASNRFLVKLNAVGEFTDLRGFLVDLTALGYFEGIEEIDIRAAEGGAEEFALKIWMARE